MGIFQNLMFEFEFEKVKWNVSMEVLDPYITIQSYAFLNCRNLQKVILSESSVYCLEEGSFSYCYNLNYVILLKKNKKYS